ncbi:HTTM domain-containing protein [Salinibacterium sp. PAMC 21357]|uniref:HTTM domain-containing protein n=1 Tax=Salinibacterium sp. PAMC 21357 TaxID=1112215 RepID=UPI0011463D50|nr:HTTM domain-containing protein [Salinibacterium sp. PAMC 21357]
MGTSRHIIDRVSRWMTMTPHGETSLSLLRAVVGFLGLAYYLVDYEDRRLFFGPDGVYGAAAVRETVDDLGTFDLYVLSDSVVFFEIVFHLGILLSIAVLLGVGGRVILACHYIVLWSTYTQNVALLDGGDNLLMIVIPVLLLTRCYSRFKLPIMQLPPMRHPGMFGSALNNVGLLLIAGQICIVYLMSGLYKVQGQMWQDGTALYYILRVPDFYFPGVTELLFTSDILLVLGAYATVLSSIAFPFLVLFPQGRLPAVLVMTAFHLSIATFMGLTAFALIMIACDLVFVDRHVCAGRREITAMVGRALRHVVGVRSRPTSSREVDALGITGEVGS